MSKIICSIGIRSLNTRKYLILLPAFFVFGCCESFIVKHQHLFNPWQLVYSNSSTGDALDGNLDSLISAVKNGKEIRIVIVNDSVHFSAVAEYLWVKDDIVHAQNSNSVSVKFNDEKLIFQDNSYYWMFIVNTKGERDMIRWSVGEHELRGRNSDRVSIKWFVKR